MTIGELIKTKRKILKIKQKELADKVCLSRASIVYIEKNKQDVSFSKALLIANTLDLDLNCLKEGQK